MEQFILLLIIAAISLVNWLMQKSAEHREKRKAERARGDSIHPTSDERTTQPETQFDPMDQTRKFLEALGLPDDALPPRPTMPPPLPSEEGFAPEKRDFLHKLRPDLEQRLFPEASVQVPERPIFVPRTRSVPSLAATVTVAPSSSARGLVTGLISEKDGLRRAIVMREILGPPKAFQSL
jgi:type IV secretory pathway VirB10-like protein